jgi:membrane-bound lytic murein transglycosylase D
MSTNEIPNLGRDTVRTKDVTDVPDAQKADVVTDVVTIPADSIETPTNQVGETSARKKPDAHVVQAKETLYGIARQYNVGVMELVTWNSLDLQQGIKPGQTLRLTSPEETVKTSEPEATMNVVHEVKATDTVYSIARKYGVTIKDLMEWNNKEDFNLAVGEKLRIIKR